MSHKQLMTASVTPLDRAATVDQFRERLRQVIRRSELSQTAFAAAVGVDRSTLSQILSKDSGRLPRVETLAQIAVSQQVSVDWLVGLSQEGGLGPGLLHQSFEFHADERARTEAKLAAWHEEAVGYKIRYVPSNIPDLLKIPEVIDYEFRHADYSSPETEQDRGTRRLQLQRQREGDLEVCTPIQSLELFARAQGLWWGLSADIRRRQLRHMIELSEELYPTFRWFMFDLANRWSVPLTVFGPLRVIIYIGQRYLVMTGKDQIRQLSQHFDDLIRAASVEPTSTPGRLRSLLDDI